MSAIPLIDNLLDGDRDNNLASVLILSKQNIVDLQERLRKQREALEKLNGRLTLIFAAAMGGTGDQVRDEINAALRLIEPLLKEAPDA